MDASESIEDPSNILDENASWFHRLVVYAARNPYEFCWYLLLCLSPLFFISAFLSWKLAKAIDAQKKEKIKKNRRARNIAKAQKGKAE